jgi:hypothetical protein
VCPKCGTEIPHKKGEPCSQSKCPKCGAGMVGKSREVSKPAPDVTENYIRWRIRQPGRFVENSYRIIELSKAQGIKAVIGKYKSDPDGPTHVQSVLFAKGKWTTEKARVWIGKHRDQLKTAKIRMNKKR